MTTNAGKPAPYAKEILTRDQFEAFRQEKAKEMAEDAGLQKRALEVFAQADRHYWLHQTTWFGEPIINLPQDLFALQEIIFRTRPDHIVEVGTAWGGSLLFYSTLMGAMGGKSVIAVDVFIPPDLRERIGRFGAVSKRIRWVLGSSTDSATFASVKKEIGPDDKVLVVLDSDHSHDHVLKELRMYAPLVKKGQYLVCCDTIVEKVPPHRPRPWGPGNNPLTAARQFLRESNRFEVDAALENKLLLTCNPGGYLRCVR